MRIPGLVPVFMFLVVGCNEVEPLDEAAALDRGRHIASATFMALSERLHDEMAESGPAGAVEFCSLAALPLVDSIARAEHAIVKRTSLKLRAPHDAPDKAEHKQLIAFENAWRAGEELKPLVMTLGADSVAYHAPIMIAGPLCLKCHGAIGEGLDSSANEVIRKHYPTDQAIGYSIGDLRGMWSIRWAR